MCSFESSNDKSDRVSKACRQIQLAHHSKPAYLLNISVAYDILCQNKGAIFCLWHDYSNLVSEISTD